MNKFSEGIHLYLSSKTMLCFVFFFLDEYMLGYEANDRQMIDSWSKYMALPNPDEAVGIDGYITQWNFYAKSTGIIILQV